MVLIRVRPFLFARAMMSFHKILRITERPHRADKSAIIGINLRTSPSTSVGARAMGSGGGGGPPPPPPPRLPPPLLFFVAFIAGATANISAKQHPPHCVFFFLASLLPLP